MKPGCAIIVGYGPGIGAATARTFAGAGHPVALIARNAAKLDAAAAALRADQCDAHAYPADAGDAASLTAAIAAARAVSGEPEILVYNAAHWRPGPVLSVTAEELVADFRLCAAGALTAARLVAPAMRTAGCGSILFTGGGFALCPSPEAPALSIGKGAIRALALMLAQELAPAGIRVGTVTVMGTVEPGTSRDPERIAQAFLALHRSPADPATAETLLV